MGHLLVNAVINGLKGKTPSYTMTSKTGKKKTKKFDANALALLTVIANEQPNPGTYGVDDTICYSAMENLLQLTHMPKATFAETRNFLMNLELLSYKSSEVHQDVKGGRGLKRYNYVYRVVVPKIRELQADDGPDWLRDVLRIKDRSPQQMTAAERRLLGVDSQNACGLAVHAADTTVHDVNSKVHAVDSAVHTVDTNIKKQNKTEKNTTMVLSHFSDVELTVLCGRIADVCQVEQSVVNQNILKKVVQKKDPEVVSKIVADFSNEMQDGVYRRNKAPNQRVGLLVSKLRDSPDISDEEFQKKREAQFKEMPKEKTKEEILREKMVVAFKKMETLFKLVHLPKEERDKLWADFRDKFLSLRDDLRDDHFRIFIEDCGYEVKERCPNGEDVSQKMSVEERLALIRKLLNERHD